MRDREPVNILLVDDQPAKLLSYEAILEELGENLIKATSGRQALEQLLRQEVAVVLVDVSMPELDGFELAGMIREHPRFTRTAIIFVSAIHLSEIDSLRGFQAGAVDYLPVPVTPALMRAKVRVFCELYRKTRQLEKLNAELEQRVAERTAELAAANEDLERRVEARTREREEALAQVAEMQKLESLGQLTGGLAHDFNNLLMVVMSNIEMASSRVREDERVARWLGRAMEAAASGAALTKRMLAFARRQHLKPESFPLAEAVNGMVEMMSHSLDPRVRILVDLPGDLPLVRIDRNQLELALLNLGLNARDAMPSGGEIRIKARAADAAHLPEKLARGAYVHLSVADEGVGMDAEILKRASEPFFTTKPKGKGSGLGLSMVQGLTLQSGGGMQIASRPNEGTRVSLWLPVAPDITAGEDEKNAPVAADGARLRILLVDDDPLVLTSTADMLRELGHDPVGIASAAEALETLQAGERPDLAILDYAMPEMTGAALAKLVREACPGLPLFLATGYADQVKTGVDLPKLDKPFTIAELARQIAALAPRRV
ncbi:MAG: response regulator [Hyphomicrobiales bacterium]|nr:response regulator [Hyphomicrobiales bacterium]